MNFFEQLYAPFPVHSVSWRVGATNQKKTNALALAYIDARDVYERLDTVVGPAHWQNRYPHANGKTVCEIGVEITGQWIWKANGAGDTDMEAEKGALSDAFKRAAVCWGVGRYLYDLPAIWVEIEPLGKSYKIKDSEHSKLERVLREYQDRWKTYGLLSKAVAAAKSKEEVQQWFRDNADTIKPLPEPLVTRLRSWAATIGANLPDKLKEAA